MLRLRQGALAAASIFALACFGPAIAQDDPPPFVDGNSWSDSSENEKISYIVGAADMLLLEYITQSKAETPVTDDQSSIRHFYEDIDELTANEVVAVVDAWYSANPDSQETPVLVVIWNELVENEK